MHLKDLKPLRLCVFRGDSALLAEHLFHLPKLLVQLPVSSYYLV